MLPERERRLHSRRDPQLIFDWSGTLVDDLPAVWQATNHVLAQAGRPEMTLEQFRAEFCLPFTIFYDRHVPHVPLPQLEDWFHGRFRQVQDSVCELPHAREFLEFCRARKLRTFLLSTVHARPFRRADGASPASALSWTSPTSASGTSGRRSTKSSRKTTWRRDETLFIGDMQHDIETARHGGIHSCAVLTGYNTLEQLRAAEPDLIVEHLGELRDILEQNELAPQAAGEAVRGSHPPVVTVGALIFNGAGEVLMIRTHKWSNLWGIPGGKIKWGEPSEDALRRELKEETNLDIADIEFVLVQDCIHSKEFYRDAHFVLLNYTCRCAGEPAVKLNDEAREFRWVTPAQALAMPINQPTRTLLLAVTRAETHKRKQACRKSPLLIWKCSTASGVPDEERAKPQRLLLTVEMNFDFSSAAVSDRIEKTINYQTVAEDLLKFGEGRSWKLIEKLVDNVADRILAEYKPQAVLVEAKEVLDSAGALRLRQHRQDPGAPGAEAAQGRSAFPQ